MSLAVLALCLTSTPAQSIDQSAPTPIRSNSLNGRIAARDIGDARLTDHYYALAGVPGDLILTVQANNLNGDIDVFTASSLRPLLKLTLYAESSAPVTKSIYLRRREDLVLRVEARSPNDDEGSYQISFSGSFEAIAGGPDNSGPEATTPLTATTPSGTKKTRRVSSVGARIEEPVTEVAAAPTPEPTPLATPESKPVESQPNVSASTPKTPTPRTARARRPVPRKAPAPKPAVKETETKEETKTEETSNVAVPTESQPKTSPPTRKSTARANRTAKPEPVPSEPPPDTGPRLVIETNDGTLINRSMSGVRRIMVENGQVVVVGRDGKVDRFLLTSIVRMSIAQQ